MIGVGFDVVPTADELDAIERAFAARGATLQAEVATLADPAFLSLLGARGYVVQGFENVLGRPLAPSGAEDDQALAPRAASHAHAIEVRPMQAGEESAWTDVDVTAFLHADTEGVQAEPLPPRETLERAVEEMMLVPGFLRYAAWLDGQMVGVAALRLDDGLAQLCGAATLPAWRRRGVQSALLHHRLAVARDAGCALALMTTAPGTKSQENGLRQGFALLYARALFVKKPRRTMIRSTTATRSSC
jgi:GNAT superfamily N-acetyltransferase